jgi:signal transduction histidine kinase
LIALTKIRILVVSSIALLVLAAILFYMYSPWRGLPYQDSFSLGKAEGWTPYSGNWSILNGTVKNDSNDRGAKYITGSGYWENYSVEADVQLLANGGDAGLIIRASDIEQGVDSYNGYYAGLRSTDNSLVLGRAEYGWIEFPPAKMPEGVIPGKWYHLKLGAYGCSISASATEIGTNNAQTIAARDPHCFTSGKIGLRSMASGGIWRNIRVERISSSDAALLASAEPPSQTAVYPTNQGMSSLISAPHSIGPLIEGAHPAGPVQSIQSLRLFSATRPARAIVRGSVIFTEPLYVQDSSGGVQVELKSKLPLRVGDEVEIEGDVYPHGLSATIRDATARPLGGMAPTPPLSVTADQAATGAYHAMFIEVEGTLQGKVLSANGSAILELRDGQQVFRAIANSSATAASFKDFEKNSLLRLRGICLVDAAYTQNAVPFAVLVNSPEDVRVLVGPPWWSMEHLIVLAIIMLAVGFTVHLLYSRAEEWRLRAVIDERERLAHEIHDTLAQSFAGIGFQLRAIRNRILKSKSPLDQSALIEELNRASELVRHSHDEARRSITTLRPDATEAGGLIAALEKIARQMVGRAPTEIETSVEGDARTIPLRILDSLFRIGQESIANAMQHGHPSKLGIRAIYSPSAITLVIEDNGAGFVQNPDANGFGLTGIRRRAESIQGILEIETAPASGTRITVKVPVVIKRFKLWRLAYDDGEREFGDHVS